MNIKNIKLKRAIYSDVDRVYKVYKSAWSSHAIFNNNWDDEYQLKVVRSIFVFNNIFLIMYGGRCVGYIEIEYRSSSNIYIKRFDILQNYQRKGVGSISLSLLLNLFRNLPMKFMLHVRKDNYAAIKFYEVNGFKLVLSDSQYLLFEKNNYANCTTGI